MGYPIEQNQTAQPLEFFLVLSSDHITGLTGAIPTVVISKNGSSFAAPAGAVSEIGFGWYQVAGNATDSGVLGPLVLHSSAAGSDPTDDLFPVVAYNPLSALATPTNITSVGSVASPVEVGSYASGQDPATLIFGEDIYTGWTFLQYLKVIFCPIAGPSSGLPTGSPVYQDPLGVTRITCTAIAGNRSVFTYNNS